MFAVKFFLMLFLNTGRQLYIMKLLKSIISAVILYAIIFLVASALLFAVPANTFGPIVIILVAAFTYIVSKFFYFKGIKVANPVKEGLMLGLVFIVVTFILDVFVMVYGFASDQGWSYFMSWEMCLGYVLTLLVPVLAAWKKEKRVVRRAKPRRKR